MRPRDSRLAFRKAAAPEKLQLGEKNERATKENLLGFSGINKIQSIPQGKRPFGPSLASSVGVKRIKFDPKVKHGDVVASFSDLARERLLRLVSLNSTLASSIEARQKKSLRAAFGEILDRSKLCTPTTPLIKSPQVRRSPFSFGKRSSLPLSPFPKPGAFRPTPKQKVAPVSFGFAAKLAAIDGLSFSVFLGGASRPAAAVAGLVGLFHGRRSADFLTFFDLLRAKSRMRCPSLKDCRESKTVWGLIPLERHSPRPAEFMRRFSPKNRLKTL